jgi:pyridoxamine 5'-phosphate oxidase
MIQLQDISNQTPYLIFKEKYYEAINAGQKNIEAIAISSFNKKLNEVDSRFVNLKFINDVNFIFFSNYHSPKSKAFSSYNQISALFYWSSTNTQIRMKAKIHKTSIKFNNDYFQNRSIEKNALAIASHQSSKIISYEDLFLEYKETIKNQNLTKCPDYWGGFSFAPYYFEFWEGHESRVNIRNVYEKKASKWKQFIIQP